MAAERRSASGAVWVLFAAAAVFATIGWVRERGRSAGLTPVAERGQVRSLEFPLAADGVWRMSDQRGHVVAVNLWATWCGPCREETPMLVRLAREQAGTGLRVVGVSLDDGADRTEKVRAFAGQYDVPYPLAFPVPMSQIAAGLEGIPTTMLFDREGRLAKVYVGEARERAFREDVTALLRER